MSGVFSLRMDDQSKPPGRTFQPRSFLTPLLHSFLLSIPFPTLNLFFLSSFSSLSSPSSLSLLLYRSVLCTLPSFGFSLVKTTFFSWSRPSLFLFSSSRQTVNFLQTILLISTAVRSLLYLPGLPSASTYLYSEGSPRRLSPRSAIPATIRDTRR